MKGSVADAEHAGGGEPGEGSDGASITSGSAPGMVRGSFERQRAQAALQRRRRLSVRAGTRFATLRQRAAGGRR